MISAWPSISSLHLSRSKFLISTAADASQGGWLLSCYTNTKVPSVFLGSMEVSPNESNDSECIDFQTFGHITQQRGGIQLIQEYGQRPSSKLYTVVGQPVDSALMPWQANGQSYTFESGRRLCMISKTVK